MLLNLIFISSQIHVRGKLRLTGLFFLRLNTVGAGKICLMLCVFFGGRVSGMKNGPVTSSSGLDVGNGTCLPNGKLS